jgi:hypothetical protein
MEAEVKTEACAICGSTGSDVRQFRCDKCAIGIEGNLIHQVCIDFMVLKRIFGEKRTANESDYETMKDLYLSIGDKIFSVRADKRLTWEGLQKLLKQVSEVQV